MRHATHIHRFNFNLPEAEAAAFRARCDQDKKTYTEVVRALVKQWMGDNTSVRDRHAANQEGQP